MSEKTVTVISFHGIETRIAAQKWTRMADGALIVGDAAQPAAEYGPGQWIRVIDNDTLAPDATLRALDIARTALRQISETVRGGTEMTAGHTLARVLELAGTACDGISAELD